MDRPCAGRSTEFESIAISRRRRTVATVIAGAFAAVGLAIAERHGALHVSLHALKYAYIGARDAVTEATGLDRGSHRLTAADAKAGGDCSPEAVNPRYAGCFESNSPYRHTTAALVAAGAVVHGDATAINYWNNGNPLTANNINADGHDATTMWMASATDPAYVVSCPAYKPGYCNAATSVTGLKVHIPAGAAPTSDSDHHIFIFDSGSAQEVDMWGGFDADQACQVGTLTPGVLTCSWGGRFSLHGNGLASVAGNSGIAGGVAYGMAALTAGDILSGHITHALGIISPCLDAGGHYPSTPGRGTDSSCRGNASGNVDGREPTLHYGGMIHLRSAVNINAPPYAQYSPYCRVVIKALQEYGAYADDNSNGYGLHLIVLDQMNPGWQIIMASMIAGGDAIGSPRSASWNSCLNRINGNDLETITINQGDGTIGGADVVLPPADR